MAVLNNLFKIIHSKFAFFKSKMRFFVKISMKFCRNFTNMLRMSRIFNFSKKKDPIFGKIRENFGNVPIIQKIIQNYSVVSLAQAPNCVRRDGAARSRGFRGKRRANGHVSKVSSQNSYFLSADQSDFYLCPRGYFFPLWAIKERFFAQTP